MMHSTSKKSRFLNRQTLGTLLRVFSFLLISVIAIFVAIPFLWMISTSLKPDLHAVFQSTPQWIPHPLAWGNYLKAWNAAPFNRYLMNSVIVSVSTVAFQVVNACLTAYVFSKIRFPGAGSAAAKTGLFCNPKIQRRRFCILREFRFAAIRP